ncbi:MAG: InlB B-repeat-containing protein [Coriobacteriales bacterium]|nr:InlB B-repeat-containing protein [Coriobacteriales bacterium]
MGTNQAAYLNYIYGDAALPAVGTVAFVPTYAQSNAPDEDAVDWDYYDYGAKVFGYSRYIYKAGNFQETVYFDKYVVAAADGGSGYWQSDSNTYVAHLNFSLKGMVYYDGDLGKSKTFWLAPGAKIPYFKINKVKHAKFKGWYTRSMKGGKKVKPWHLKAQFGSGYSKYYYARWYKKVKLSFDAHKGYIVGKHYKMVRYGAKYGKLPTARRTGYHFLGWYEYSKGYFYSWESRSSDEMYDATTVKLKARWVKKGKGASVTLKEFSRFKANRNYGLTYKDVKAIFGGSGLYYGSYYNGYYGKVYRWYGPSSYGHTGYNKVTLVFSNSGYKHWFWGQACNPFNWS